MLLGGVLLLGSSQQAAAQGATDAASDRMSWYTMENNTLVLRTSNKNKPVKTTPVTKDVAFPDGMHLDYATHSLVRQDGSRVELKEGDILSANGQLASAATAKPRAKAAATWGGSSAAFTYQPVAPVNGKLKGVVELGASGFNMFIIRVDEQRNWKLEKVEYGNSLVMENMATEDDIRKGLKAYIGQMLDFGVGGHDIHFIVSSGADMAKVTAPIVQNLKALSYVVTTVTPAREGALGFKAAVPKPYVDKAFMVDIGSGNTKIAWMENGNAKVVDTYGAKYFQQTTDTAVVAREVRTKAAQVPSSLRGTCFIMGGVPFEMAKVGRQEKEPYTALQPAAAYSQLQGAKAQAGLTIYRAIAAATGCQQFIFGWDTNFTIGYLLSLP
ncbi:hypothetical protein BXP70_15465 [Hymenobacter crusticola]|uniref:Ppx/GppA phosphatase domain-containing protein n=1 Tax=Hymenobacter crusticola TaxID=1770526 RepID=A0A243WDQ3_9BACT|nr:hypothetical protein BXP70_15465 [Hymenobacter crusticola]